MPIVEAKTRPDLELMDIKKSLLVLAMLGLLVAGIGFDVLAQEDELPDELKLFEEIPVVISPAKIQQKISRAPSTVYVFSGQRLTNFQE